MRGENGRKSRLQQNTRQRTKKVLTSQEGRDVVKWRELTLFVYIAFLGLPPILVRAMSCDPSLFSRSFLVINELSALITSTSNPARAPVLVPELDFYRRAPLLSSIVI